MLSLVLAPTTWSRSRQVPTKSGTQHSNVMCNIYNSYLYLYIYTTHRCPMMLVRGRQPMVFLGKTYNVSQYDSHPSMNLGVKWDLCILFVKTAVKCQDCKFV